MKQINKERLFFVGFLILLFLIACIGCGEFKEIHPDKSFIFISCTEDITEAECLDDRSPQSINDTMITDQLILYKNPNTYKYPELLRDYYTCLNDFNKTTEDGYPCPFDAMELGRDKLVQGLVSQCLGAQEFKLGQNGECKLAHMNELIEIASTRPKQYVRGYFLKLSLREVFFQKELALRIWSENGNK